MMRKSLAAALALLLTLCLLMGTVGALSEGAAAPAGEDELTMEIVAVEEEEDEVVSAPVDEVVDEEKEATIWTDEIAADVKAAEAAELEKQREEEAHAQEIAESVKIAKANFPDATFRAYIEENFDTNGDGYLSASEIADVTEITYNGDDYGEVIASIEGVKVFKNLELLDVRYNALTKVDVGGLNNLDKLVLWGNRVSSLNVVGCTVLRYLDVDDNQLRTLTARGLTHLETLWARRNGMTTLNLSGCTNLTSDGLHLTENETLSINLSGCTSLDQFDTGSSGLSGLYIKSLDVSGCTSLSSIGVRQNQLQSVNIKNCEALRYMSVYDNELTEIDLTGCPNMKGAADAGATLDSDNDLCFTSCSCGSLFIDYGVKLKYNGSYLRYLIDGEPSAPAVEPTKIYFTKKTVTVKMGKTVNLRKLLKVRPADADGCALTWSSGSKKIATVDEEGIVTPVKPGTAKITVKTDNGLKATIKVKVTAVKPTKVTIIAPSKEVEVGQKLELTAKLKPSNAYSKLTWISSKKSVATVNNKGVVTAKKAGKVKITVKTANGKKHSITIRVKKKGSNPVKYRALLIAQCNYTAANPLPGCAGDAALMKTMLDHCSGGEGGSWTVVSKQDMSYSGFFSAIDSAFAGADDNDVSLLFYSGHGASDGSLCAVPDAALINQSTIANKLKNMPGKFIIMYDSCHSGSGIYEYGEENSANNADALFDAAVVNAFEAADPGILVDAKGDVVMGDATNTGELRVENKFYVLTAARKSEYSWCTSQCSAFTEWACDAVGTSGRMPADTNSDGIATLNEMFKYISSVGDDQVFSGSYHQHVQVYPRNSSFKMFKR